MDANKCSKYKANLVQPGHVNTQTTGEANKTKKKRNKAGRRRRGKRDVILDFSKKVKSKSVANNSGTTVEGKPGDRILTSGAKKRNKTTINIPSTQQTDVAPMISISRRKAKSNRGKLSLSTSNRDYGGNLGLPEKVAQREHETTGQFFRRLDRLAAKAKVEASMESRFDMTLSKE